MYAVKIANNSGKLVNWDYFQEIESAQREREILITENNFWPDDVFVEKVC